MSSFLLFVVCILIVSSVIYLVHKYYYDSILFTGGHHSIFDQREHIQARDYTRCFEMGNSGPNGDDDDDNNNNPNDDDEEDGNITSSSSKREHSYSHFEDPEKSLRNMKLAPTSTTTIPTSVGTNINQDPTTPVASTITSPLV